LQQASSDEISRKKTRDANETPVPFSDKDLRNKTTFGSDPNGKKTKQTKQPITMADSVVALEHFNPFVV